METDAELLRRYVDFKSDEAFGQLVRIRIGMVYAVALRCTRESHWAEDATQRVFTSLARNADNLSGRATIVGWLYRSAHNAAVDIVKSENRRRRREEIAIEEAETTTIASGSDADWVQVRPILDAALAELRDVDRDALLLRYFDGRPLGQVGASLGLSENAARMRIERALQKLRGRLARKGITSSVLALESALAKSATAPGQAALSAAVSQTALNFSATTAAASTGVAFFAGKFGLTAALLLTVGAAGFAGDEMARYFLNRHGLARSAALVEQDELNLNAARNLVKRAQADRSQYESEQRKEAFAALHKPDQKDAGVWNARAEGEAVLAHHPEVRAALIADKSAGIRSTYGLLFGQLGLDQAQIDEFIQIRLDHSNQSFPYGPKGQLITISAGANLSDSEVDANLQALLGDGGYQAYQQFNQTIGARWVTEQVAGALAFTDSPLSVAQVQGLTNLVASNTARNGDPSQSASMTHWDAVMQSATSFLSPAQVSVLAGIRDQSEAQWEIDHSSPQVVSASAPAKK